MRLLVIVTGVIKCVQYKKAGIKVMDSTSTNSILTNSLASKCLNALLTLFPNIFNISYSYCISFFLIIGTTQYYECK